MNLDYLCRQINIEEECIDMLKAISMEEDKYQRLYRLYHESHQEFYKEVLSWEKSRQYFLYLYLRFASETYKTYKKLGINDKIYFDTFSDIAIWCSNCQRDFGEYGIVEYDWLWRHIDTVLFKLGRLQFELSKLPEDISFNGDTIVAGTKVLNVHIPQGEPLQIPECRKSIAAAKNMLPHYKYLVCHSWLLNPDLKEILTAESNIIQFQNLFYIYGLEEESREAEERIFIWKEENPECYKAVTALQKNARDFLISGKKLGSAFGIVKKTV